MILLEKVGQAPVAGFHARKFDMLSFQVTPFCCKINAAKSMEGLNSKQVENEQLPAKKYLEQGED